MSSCRDEFGKFTSCRLAGLQGLRGFGTKPRKGTAEWKSYLLGREAKVAEARNDLNKYDSLEARHEALVTASRTPNLAQRHRDAWMTGKWS